MNACPSPSRSDRLKPTATTPTQLDAARSTMRELALAHREGAMRHLSAAQMARMVYAMHGLPEREAGAIYIAALDGKHPDGTRIRS